MQQKLRIIITIILTVIEFYIVFLFVNSSELIINYLDKFNGLISFIFLGAPLYFLNYFIIAPLVYWIYSFIWLCSGHYNYLQSHFDKIISNCAAWLVGTNKNWGLLDTSEICQNANTCEGLLALKSAGIDKKMVGLYSNILDSIISSTTDVGLESKSLKSETVVCTSMILYIFSKERKKSSKKLCDKFDKIAKNLWDVKGNRGWGVYVYKTEENYSIANTFWALWALSKYSIGKTNEYREYIIKIFGYSNQSSLFGYILGDRPRLSPTAMSIILYFNLDKSLRSAIDITYNIDQAVNFVYKTFCYEEIQYEMETLNGIDLIKDGAKKAPWTHISSGFAIAALNFAHCNKHLSLFKMNIFIARVKKICKVNLKYPYSGIEKCYYLPTGMEIHNNGIFTFPTAYLIMGLSTFKLISKRNS